MNARSIALTLSGLTLAALCAGATPALADGPRVELSVNFRVPARIHVHHAPVIRPYYMGHVYYGPHRHVHRVYAFPVRGVYVPHVYCDGALVRTGYVPGYDPRYDDHRHGYGEVIWDGPLAPAYVGIDLRYRPRWYRERYVVRDGRRYGDGYRYHHRDHDRDDDDRRKKDRDRHDRRHRHDRD